MVGVKSGGWIPVPNTLGIVTESSSLLSIIYIIELPSTYSKLESFWETIRLGWSYKVCDR